MTYEVMVLPEAKFLFAEANAWWVEHRPAALSRVVDEYARLIHVLADAPNSGTFYGNRGGQEVRRLRLQGTPYFLYYFVSDAEREVLVVSLWSATRADGPHL
jgi:plasmid stabilization system protein ParE